MHADANTAAGNIVELVIFFMAREWFTLCLARFNDVWCGQSINSRSIEKLSKVYSSDTTLDSDDISVIGAFIGFSIGQIVSGDVSLLASKPKD